MANEFTEKRRFKRVPLSLSVSGKSVEGFFRGHNFNGETQDISYDGLCIKISEPNGFNTGQRIKFKTRLYEGDFSLKASGIVRWVEPASNSEEPVKMGIKLTKIGHYGQWCEKIEKKIAQL